MDWRLRGSKMARGIYFAELCRSVGSGEVNVGDSFHVSGTNEPLGAVEVVKESGDKDGSYIITEAFSRGQSLGKCRRYTPKGVGSWYESERGDSK